MDKYYQSKDFKRILSAYEAMQKGGVGEFLDAEELTDIVEYYHLKGQEKERDSVLDYTLEMYPGAASPLIFKARMELLICHNVEAAKRFADLVEDKEHLEYIYFQIELLLVLGEFEKADKYMHAHINATEDEEEREDYILDMACFFLDYEEPERAKAWLLQVEDKSSAIYLELKARYLKSSGKYDESEGIYKTLIDDDPYSGKYWNQLAQSQIQHKDFAGAIASSEYAIAIDPEDEEAVLNKATALLGNNNPEEALKYYLRYKKQNPQADMSFLNITIGHIQLMLGEREKAVASFWEAYEAAEDKLMAMMHIAISAFDNGYVEYAYTIFEQVLTGTDRKWTFGYGYLARCCYELKQMEAYQTYLKIAVERCPEECEDVLSDLYPENIPVEDYPNTPLMDFLDK